MTIAHRLTCATGGFYKSPSAATVVDSSDPLQISWDTTCLDTTAVDIYLFAPLAATSRVHIWQNVDYAYGSYNATLQPSWWNSTKSVSLQLEIIESGMPTFMATLPAGPIWNATYSKSDASTNSDTASGSISEDVNNVPKHGLSKGKVAAAVIMTLLAVAGILAGVYIWRSRKRREEKRKRFSVAVDKRMSTISTEWRPVTTAGATHAVRSSVYSGGDRASTIDGGQASIGSHSLRLQTTEEELSPPVMAQVRPGFRASLYSAADRQSRVSRVSFAPDMRPSSEYRRTRAFHDDYVPPLPDAMSPTQTAGPFSLSSDDIRAHMSGQEFSSSNRDSVSAALSMMRTGSSPTDDSYIIPAMMKMPEPELPMPPAAALQAPSAPQSPILGGMPMPSIPGIAMTPDDMLRA
ncbi:hypothetical protein EVJ58_g11041, partial [Rhodofomes roseus]